MTVKLLTEREVAEILRCSTSTVKRLRLAGRLTYLPGRPVFVTQDDLIAFVEARKRRAVPPKKPLIGAVPISAEREAEIKAQVQRNWLRRKLRAGR